MQSNRIQRRAFWGGVAAVLALGIFASAAQAGVTCHAYSNKLILPGYQPTAQLCDATLPFTGTFESTLHTKDPLGARIYLMHLRKGQRVHDSATMLPGYNIGGGTGVYFMPVTLDWYDTVVPCRSGNCDAVRVHVVGYPAYQRPGAKGLQLIVWGQMPIGYNGWVGPWPTAETLSGLSDRNSMSVIEGGPYDGGGHDCIYTAPCTGTGVVNHTGWYEAVYAAEGWTGTKQSPTPKGDPHDPDLQVTFR